MPLNIINNTQAIQLVLQVKKSGLEYVYNKKFKRQMNFEHFKRQYKALSIILEIPEESMFKEKEFKKFYNDINEVEITELNDYEKNYNRYENPDTYPAKKRLEMGILTIGDLKNLSFEEKEEIFELLKC